MTKRKFYDLGLLMKNDSTVLFNINAYHNSVYLAAFVLESYIKILFIHNGANTPRGQRIDSYGGHINDGRMIQRLQTLHPNMFSGSILEQNHSRYPNYLMSNDYDINYRYEVDKWTDEPFCECVQNEILEIINEMNDLRNTIGI